MTDTDGMVKLADVERALVSAADAGWISYETGEFLAEGICALPRASWNHSMEEAPRPACHGECGEDDDDDFDRCPTCKGRGTVNPLTAPPDFFCAGVADCPHCDGTGRI